MRDLLERAGISMHVLKIPYLSPSTSFSLSLLLCRSISRSFCFYNLYINYISLYIDHLTWLYLYFHFSLSLSLSIYQSIYLNLSPSLSLSISISLSPSFSLSTRLLLYFIPICSLFSCHKLSDSFIIIIY